MIIDSHAYCFPPPDDPAGHGSSREHLDWLQVVHGFHHQPAWRIRDGAAGSSEILAPKGWRGMDDLPDLSFRPEYKRGRFVWTIDGDDYTKQFYPPNLHNLEYTPDSLVSEMDYAGVDKALLHTDPMLGRDPAFQAACVNAYPDRILSMIPVDEWRIAVDPDGVLESLERAAKDYRLHAVKFIPTFAYMSSSDPWDGGLYEPFWECAASLGLPVFFTLASGPGTLEGEMSSADQREGYFKEQDILMNWMARYPDALCSLTHGFPWRAFWDGDHITLPPEIWEPFSNPGCSLEVCFPIRLGDIIDFPYREVWQTLEEMVERIGTDRLLWGTDMPFQNRFCTYRQSRRWLEKYCTFLSKEDIRLIMGDTAGRILGIENK